MKRLILLFVLLTNGIAFSINFRIPDFRLYTEMNNKFTFATSYKIDLLLDTGLKYGLKMNMRFKAYQVQSFTSNFVNLSALRAEMTPADKIHVGFFLGDSYELGSKGVNYTGYQYHQRNGLEYIGYHTISGTGLEVYANIWDTMLEPHLLIYSYQKPLTNGGTTNIFAADSIVKLNTDNYKMEIYFGVNFNAVFQLYKHIGFTFRTLNPKVNFLLSIYFPDSLFADIPSTDSIYLNLTEQLHSGIFEQVITLFSRPSEYNNIPETITSSGFTDLDFYFSLGLVFNNFGFGAENIMTYADPASFGSSSTTDFLSDRVGAYMYFALNNLKYKVGAFYSTGPYYTSAYTPDNGLGFYIKIKGQI